MVGLLDRFRSDDEPEHVHSVAPEDAWKEGLSGTFAKGWVIGLTLIIEVLGLVGLGVLVNNWTIATVLGVLILGLTAGFLLTRRYYIVRKARQDDRLHKIYDQARDTYNQIDDGGTDNWKKLETLSDDIVERVARYFDEKIAQIPTDDRICCAIRVARKEDGEREYVTIARSDGMEDAREAESEPLPAGEGIAQKVRDRPIGAILIPSIPEAISKGWWKPMDTDDYEDVNKLMVAPINYPENGGKAVLGLLYVTSVKTNFEPRHTLPLLGIADSIAFMYSTLVDAPQVDVDDD